MVRKKSVSYTVFNVRLHPHSPEIYVSLFNRLFSLRRQIQIRGETYGLLTQIKKISDDPIDGICGELTKFTKIESGQWFNIHTLRAAEENETQQIQIPEELRPNFSSFNFVFYPRSHYLVIECKDSFGQISPNYLESYFRKLLDDRDIFDEFNYVELTLAPRSDVLDSVIYMKQLNTLEITLRRPNPDDFDDLEDEILERLNRQNVEEEVIVLKSQKGMSITADSRTIALSHIAQLNGEVKGTGYNESGVRVEKSTKKHPFTESYSYNPDEITATDFLLSIAGAVIDKVRVMARARP